MAGQMAELLKAFAEKGVQLPGAKVETRKVLPPASGESSQHTGQSAKTPTVSPRQPQRYGTQGRKAIRPDRRGLQEVACGASGGSRQGAGQIVSKGRSLACYDSSPAREGKSPEGKVSPYEVRLGSAAGLALTLDEQVELEVLDGYEELGRAASAATTTADDEHPDRHGSRFRDVEHQGGDRRSRPRQSLRSAVLAASDVARYLLPTRLHESAGRFSLCEGDETHRDLKLALIANPGDLVLRERVSAMLALVIRQSSGLAVRNACGRLRPNPTPVEALDWPARRPPPGR